MKKQNNHLNCIVMKAAGCLMFMAACFLLFKSALYCTGNDIWFDELFSVKLAEYQLKDMLSLAAKDVHPPLYYMYVRLITILCKPLSTVIPGMQVGGAFFAVAAAKAATIIPYLILVIYAVTVVRKEFGCLTMGIFSFCLLAMPKMSSYTVEIRMYSLALFFVTAAFLHAYLFYKYERRLHLVILFILGVGAAYTHYFACISVAIIYLILGKALMFSSKELKRQHIKLWFMAVAGSCVSFLPWLMVLVKQIGAVKNNYWIPPVTLRTLAGCVKYLFMPGFENAAVNLITTLILILCYAGVLIFSVIQSIKNHKEERILSLLPFAGVAVLAGTVLVGFFASLLIRPIFVYRYMTPAMGCFWLGFAVGAEKIVASINEWDNEKFAKISAPIAVILLMCIIGIVGKREYNLFRWEEDAKLERMQETNQFFESVPKDAVILCNFNQIQAIMWYYLDNDSYLWGETEETLIADICGRAPIKMLTDYAQVKELVDSGKEVMFFGSGNVREDILQEFADNGLNNELTEDSLFVERYWFNVYRIYE